MTDLWWLLVFTYHNGAVTDDVFAAPTERSARQLAEDQYDLDTVRPVKTEAYLLVPYGLTNSDLKIRDAVQGVDDIVCEWWSINDPCRQYVDIWRDGVSTLYSRPATLYKTDWGWRKDNE